MYTVYLDDEILFYPEDEERIIANSKLEQALNECGTFEFDIPYNHPLYDSFALRQSIVTVYKDDTEIFCGEVREVSPNMDFTEHVYVVSEMAFLFDSIQPQADYSGYTVTQLFTAIITEHNSQVESGKQFTVGAVTATDSDSSAIMYTNYQDTLTTLRTNLCDTIGGYLRIRKSGDVRYIDLVTLTDYGSVSSQEIEFGENLLDYACNMNGQDIATAVVPLGAKLDESAIEGLDAYLTIEDATTEPSNTTHPSGENYLYSDAVDTYGYVKAVKKWDNITDADTLLEAADTWLTSAQYETMTLEINAFDQSIIDTDIESYEVGDYVVATAEPFGMSSTSFPIQKKTTYLQDASKNYIVLGSTIQRSYTKQASDAVSVIEQELPQESSILQAAKSNAIAILEGTDGGYLIFGFNDDNQIESLSIMDASTEENALKKWVWNMGGFGYFSRDSISDDWTDLGVAMTMDGAIVADFITTGSLTADIIKAGILQDQATGEEFYLNLTTGVLKGNFTELSISASSVATESYASSVATSAASSAISDMSQSDVFNKLTNNGALQGLYMSGGELYINASYIQSGTISCNYLSGGTISGQTIKGGTITGTTISGGTISSTSSGHSVTISGGSLVVVNDDDNFLKLEQDDADLALGGKYFAAYNDDVYYGDYESIYIGKAAMDAGAGSDRRLKQNIQTLDTELSRNIIRGSRPVSFEYIPEKGYHNEHGTRYGLIAQELREVLDENNVGETYLEYERSDGYRTIEYREMIAHLMNCVKDLYSKIEVLQTEINTLKGGNS